LEKVACRAFLETLHGLPAGKDATLPAGVPVMPPVST
jgi:hypothetical protein